MDKPENSKLSDYGLLGILDSAANDECSKFVLKMAHHCMERE